MTENDLLKKLKNLEATARELNIDSDKLNRIIASLNLKLAAMNLGFEGWLDQPLETSEIEPLYLSDEKQSYRHYETVLGYAEVEGKWQLALKTTGFLDEVAEANDEPPPSQRLNIPQLKSLLKASRQLRLKALAAMPDLLDALNERASGMVETIQGANP